MLCRAVSTLESEVIQGMILFKRGKAVQIAYWFAQSDGLYMVRVVMLYYLCLFMDHHY